MDDKGVQRTTQYIAGAGIGYRIVQDTTGTGSHLLPRPAVVEFGILYPMQPGNRSPNAPDNGIDTGQNNSPPNNDSNNPSNTNGGRDPGSGTDGIGNVDNNSIDSDANFGDDFDTSNRPGSDSGFPKHDWDGGTLITNTGDMFFGIGPGASVRAHVQNIDLRPFGEGGAVSPSEALRRDERRSFRSRFRG